MALACALMMAVLSVTLIVAQELRKEPLTVYDGQGTATTTGNQQGYDEGA